MSYDLKAEERDMKTHSEAKPESPPPARQIRPALLLRDLRASVVNIRAKQSQFPAAGKKRQVFFGKGVMVNSTFDRLRQNKANSGGWDARPTELPAELSLGRDAPNKPNLRQRGRQDVVQTKPIARSGAPSRCREARLGSGESIMQNKANFRHGVRRAKGFTGKELW
jgi:hypothetical protein